MIIGITGTDGAGKGTVVDYLVAHKGFTHYSSRAFITKEIEARGLEVSRDQARLVANDLRRLHGNDVIVKFALEAMSRERSERAVIESIRTTAEADTLRAAGGVLLAVDADQHLRYERITARGSATDRISFEQFQAQEAIEMNDPDSNGMQKAKVMAMAGYTIMNDTDLDSLHRQIEDVLVSIES